MSNEEVEQAVRQHAVVTDCLRGAIYECSQLSNHMDLDCLVCATARKAIKELEALLDILERQREITKQVQ